MTPTPRGTTKATFVDLEFDTTANRGAPLGDIASSLVSLHDLLRDLATLTAYPSSAEFRDIRVVAIDIQNPLKVKLSLLAISTEAVKAFQEICRGIIFYRERRPSQELSSAQREEVDETRRATIRAALDRVLIADGKHGHITEKELQRLCGHIVTLQNAEVPLKRVVVNEER